MDRKTLASAYTTSELEVLLKEAMSAYISLISGSLESEVYVIDRKVKYHEGDKRELRNLITEIEAAISGDCRKPTNLVF